jgi:N-acetyl-gamma-glutamyl-phosphate reductase
MNAMIKAGIIGGAGYTGGELIRLLLHHPRVEIAFVQSNSQAGKAVHTVHADLLGETEIVFSAGHYFEVDVLFFCAGHGEAKKFVQEHEIPEHVKLIDIGNDFRLKADATQRNRQFVYGLPELNRSHIQEAQSIANPGCFATAIQLSLLPIVKEYQPGNINTTGITGSTGAGQNLSPTSHFSWRANNIQAYKTLTHQHMDEIMESLKQANPSCDPPDLHFVPWRGDFTRGIFTSSTVACSGSIDELYELYEQFYADAPFTHLTRSALFLKQVINTNKCIIQLEKTGRMLVIHAAIDNLVKGASGQAIQNMNLMFGLNESDGLQLKASFF